MNTREKSIELYKHLSKHTASSYDVVKKNNSANLEVALSVFDKGFEKKIISFDCQKVFIDLACGKRLVLKSEMNAVEFKRVSSNFSNYSTNKEDVDKSLFFYEKVLCGSFNLVYKDQENPIMPSSDVENSVILSSATPEESHYIEIVVALFIVSLS